MGKLSVNKSLGNNANMARNKARRVQFNKLKITKEFKSWKNIQYRVQKGKCAWCLKKMNTDYSGVHVDHAVALFHGGTNEYRNLVLSHAYCNMKKWIKIDGVPAWVENNRINYEYRMVKCKQKKLYKQLVNDEYQEQLAKELSWI